MSSTGVGITDYEGGPKLTTISVFPSINDCDGMLQSGMEDGGNEAMGQLEELLAEYNRT